MTSSRPLPFPQADEEPAKRQGPGLEEERRAWEVAGAERAARRVPAKGRVPGPAAEQAPRAEDPPFAIRSIGGADAEHHRVSCCSPPFARVCVR